MDVVEISQNKLAVGGIFVVAAGALVGMAIWLSPGQAAPAGPEIAPAGAEVSSVVSQTTTTSTGSVTVSPDAGVGQPAANGAATTTSKPGQKAPAQVQVQATDEPAPTTTTAPPPPPMTHGSYPTPPSEAPPRVAWCRDVNGAWRSGGGQGCTENSPDFVEYR